MEKGILSAIKSFVIVSVLGILLLCLIPIKSGTIAHILLSPIEKKFRKKIEFNASYIWLPSKIFLEDVTIIDKSGRLYYCKTFNLRYNLANLLFKKRDFFFDLKNIKSYRNIELLDSVTNMLVISAIPDVEFKEMKSTLQLHKNSIFIKNLYAYNNKMRIRGSGWIDSNGSLDCDVKFSFSKDITGMVPALVKTALLQYEDEGWMGIALKVKGNYKKPSLHITGDTLKLNISGGIEDLLKNR
jgi:hypothetical protein